MLCGVFSVGYCNLGILALLLLAWAMGKIWGLHACGAHLLHRVRIGVDDRSWKRAGIRNFCLTVASLDHDATSTARRDPVSGELLWGVDLTGNRAAKVD